MMDAVRGCSAWNLGFDGGVYSSKAKALLPHLKAPDWDPSATLRARGGRYKSETVAT
jgi:hypothetical protein